VHDERPVLRVSDITMRHKVGRLKAEEEIIEREALLDDPGSSKRLAEAKRDAEIYEAHQRGLKSRAEIVTTLRDLDPDTREAVIRSYGDRGLRTLYRVARRAEGGPVRPEEMSITPVENSQDLPTPLKRREIGPPRS
jgi:hypothetical protein